MKLATDQIGELGEAEVFTRLRAWGWIPRKDAPDKGYDYNVEVAGQNGKPTERFLLQVKTAARRRAKKSGEWVVRLDEASTRRYRNSRLPVFLLAVELETKQIRWLDLRAVLRKDSRTKRFCLPASTTMTMQLDPALVAAVLEASAACDSEFASAADILNRKGKDLEARDPRLSVRVDLIEGRERFVLTPKPGMSLTASFCTEAYSAQAVREAISFGIAVTADIKSFKIDGSPLFDEFRDVTGQLSFKARSHKVRIRLSAGSPDSASAAHVEFDAVVTAGVAGLRVVSDAPGSPLGLKADLVAQPQWTLAPTVTLTLDPDAWVGHSLARLPYVRPLRALLETWSREPTITLSTEVSGEFVPMFTEHMANLGEFARHHVETFAAWQSLSHVCAWIGSDARWEQKTLGTHAERYHWKWMSRLITGEFVDLGTPSATSDIDQEDLSEAELLRKLNESPEVVIDTPFALHVNGKIVGQLPVLFTLHNYFATREGSTWAFTPKVGAKATAQLSPESSPVRRKLRPAS
ncbi:MAG: DUF4365 domain-containing protein [Sinimarinibacterium flocculans]|uniref:DUF4365 domain-containing protein n=1 Tax=Sinimarinibacterium flocculans TaxID=985250 RepID=UPI003C51B73C